MATSQANAVATTAMVNLPSIPVVEAVAEQVLVQQSTTPAVVAMAEQVMLGPSLVTSGAVLAVAEQVMMKIIPRAQATTVATTAMLTLPTNTQDYNVRLEALGVGFIPASDSGVSLEVLAALPFDAEDYNVQMEALGASTFTPVVPMTSVVWFTS